MRYYTYIVEWSKKDGSGESMGRTLSKVLYKTLAEAEKEAKNLTSSDDYDHETISSVARVYDVYTSRTEAELTFKFHYIQP